MENFILGFFFSFIGCYIAIPIFLGIAQSFGFYTIVREGEALIFTLWGQVVGVLKEPGLYFLPWQLGLKAFYIFWAGSCTRLDIRIDQEYLRSQQVNSEEGAPMGIGIWYEMLITDPVAFLFKNANPRSSLAANVRSAVVRCLSNMKLADMLEDRHQMSQAVRDEVSPQSQEWGYRLGSVYVRKVHFRDKRMIGQIEEKVVNRLRQVTSAIKQDGTNQVNIITSTAENTAAVEFAKAAAMRPLIVGEALREISQDPEILQALFEILEAQRLVEGEGEIVLLPTDSGLGRQIALLDAANSVNALPDSKPT
ncbi:MAG TPA: SPFH domain-containing protein [Candidatus Ozemobacteraceae bacterium]|nr:SPFH domain-containing protein [Candidatus Ozemobacteraceae bacterium]